MSLRALHIADAALYGRAARVDSAALDAVLPRLSHSADNGKLWLGAAAVLWLSGGRFRRRGALRGVASLAGASLATNVGAKLLTRRKRPPDELVPVHRHPRRRPRSTSFPSGHTASAFAFATGVAMEERALAVPALALAGAVGYSRVHTGAHYPGDVLIGAALGAGVALGTTRWWPVAPHDGALARSSAQSADLDPAPDGAGYVIAVNPSAGAPGDTALPERLRELLPAADVVEVEPEKLAEVLRDAAGRGCRIGVAGGDGTLNRAAEVAAECHTPLVVVPGGTLNHFARDLGVGSVEDAARGVNEGGAVAVDLGEIDGEVFLNSASFGAYPEIVDIRERLEDRIGKWPALAVAMARVLRRGRPLDVEMDGVHRRVWFAFVGNCTYQPPGFAPAWRERLDDGLLDVRVVDATRRWSRTRVVCAAMTGTLGRCRVYEHRVVTELRLRGDQPLRLARDGETFDGGREVVVCKRRAALTVVRPTDG